MDIDKPDDRAEEEQPASASNTQELNTIKDAELVALLHEAQRVQNSSDSSVPPEVPQTMALAQDLLKGPDDGTQKDKPMEVEQEPVASSDLIVILFSPDNRTPDRMKVRDFQFSEKGLVSAEELVPWVVKFWSKRFELKEKGRCIRG